MLSSDLIQVVQDKFGEEYILRDYRGRGILGELYDCIVCPDIREVKTFVEEMRQAAEDELRYTDEDDWEYPLMEAELRRWAAYSWELENCQSDEYGKDDMIYY